LCSSLGAAIAARIAAPTEARVTHPSRALFCGSERWTVKTLQDRPKLYPAKFRSVAQTRRSDPA
jgi:hypothetical protein